MSVVSTYFVLPVGFPSRININELTIPMENMDVSLFWTLDERQVLWVLLRRPVIWELEERDGT
jgi:hypothetical protein